MTWTDPKGQTKESFFVQDNTERGRVNHPLIDPPLDGAIRAETYYPDGDLDEVKYFESSNMDKAKEWVEDRVVTYDKVCSTMKIHTPKGANFQPLGGNNKEE